VTETIHTIDPNLWYLSAPNLQQATKEIIANWQTDQSRLILSILVVTSDYVTEMAYKSCQAYRDPGMRLKRCQKQLRAKSKASKEDETSDDVQMLVDGPPHIEPAKLKVSEGQETEDKISEKAQKLCNNLPDIDYAFCVMDHKMTLNLFGATFTKLIQVLKKNPVKGSALSDEHQPVATGKQKLRYCTTCGQPGHNKTTCAKRRKLNN
jgi:hypothetical protein